MSDTPRTDACEDRTWAVSKVGIPEFRYVHEDFAKQLERELAELREELEIIDGHLAHATGLAQSRLEILQRLKQKGDE